jgi:excisionase family DNA binding protein
MSAADTFAAALDALRDELREELRAELHAVVAELRSAESWPAYLSVPEAARYAGVPEERVRKLLAAGTLARIQEAPGHRVLLARDDLDALMRSWRREVASR